MGGGDHLRAGKACPAEDAVEGESGQGGQEEEEATELGVDGVWPEVELLNVGDIGDGRSCGRRPFVVGAAGEASKALSLEDLVDGDRTDGIAIGL
jgi:hypothetical protein